MSISCKEARQLIDAGVQPGANTPQRAALGFHLANCPACQAYRDRADLTLLSNLLGTSTDPSIRPAPAPPPATKPLPWRHLLLIGVLLLLSGLLLFLGRLVYAAYTIRQNVAAMQITVQAGPSPTPALRVPTINPALRATTRPSLTPSVTPTMTASPAPATPSPSTSLALAGPPPGFIPSPTPILLPSIVGNAPNGPARIPTLMPTAPIIPVAGQAINILLL
ncbi:MAG: hypothetical protein HGA65_10275, partial [Oscillochloris sp.]|nr:hypothetical protein [Oscillochloris sp.]